MQDRGLVSRAEEVGFKFSGNEQNTHTMRDAIEKSYIRLKCSEKCQICSNKLRVKPELFSLSERI